ncbi:hypothetical protein I3842_05G242200 [Carya illinoinensis]|nr:hypothetical protein I3842_05G242200 [Carya illinoinensis]
MVMVYSVGHISGAHFNPAVTITFAIFRQFPVKQVPLYIFAQMLGSALGSATLCALFPIDKKSFFGTVPVGSNLQSLLLEIIISFLLMFVISGVSTDNRAIGELAGIAVGMTITLNVFVAGFQASIWGIYESCKECRASSSGAHIQGTLGVYCRASGRDHTWWFSLQYD